MLKYFIVIYLMVVLPFTIKAEENVGQDMIRNDSINMEQVIRIADIEVYPEYLSDFLKAAKEIAATSIRKRRV